jgi:antitoxin ParD1/3/4
MTSLNVSLPEAMRQFVEEQAAYGGYGTVSEYIQELIRQAQEQQAEQERLEALLLAGLNSPASEMTPEDWTQIRAEAMERLAAQKRG